MHDEGVGDVVDTGVGDSIAFVGADIGRRIDAAHERAGYRASDCRGGDGPIIVIAAGVTLTVYVAVAVGEEALEAAKRTKKLEKWCAELRQECLGNKRQPPGNSDFGTEKDCGACFRLCLHYAKWDDNKCPRAN